MERIGLPGNPGAPGPPAVAAGAGILPFLAAVPVGIVVQDGDGTIVSANPAAERILGLSLDQLQGRSWIDPGWRAIHEDGSPFPGPAHPASETLRTGIPQANVTMGVYHPAEARTCWIHVSTVPYLPPGELERHGVMSVFVDITARVEAEAELKEVAERLSLFVRYAPAAIALLDTRMHYLAVSRRWLEDYRLTDQSVVGRSHYEIFPEIPQRWREIHQRCLAGASERCDCDPFPRADGTTDWVRWEILPWHRSDQSIGGIILFSEVVTDWIRAQETIRVQQEAYRLLFDQNLDAIFLTSPDGRVLDANPAACRMFGWTVEEFREVGRARILDPADPRLMAALEERERTGTWRGELDLIRSDGTRIPCEIASSLFQDRQGRPKSSIVVRDVTGRRQAEQDRAALQAQLHQTQKLQSLGTLVAGVAHNLNNVLAIALGTASIREDAATGADREAFQSIGKACRRGRDVVKSLIHFAKPTPVAQSPIDLNAFVQEACALLESTARNRVRIVESLSAAPAWVHGNGGDLSHVLVNLGINALDAMPDGGTLTFRVSVPEPDRVEVAVEDTGAGMTPDTLAHALDPFFTTKEGDHGTGLGLSMAYGVVKAHGGTIDLASDPGRGTSVKLRFPRIPAPAGLPPAPAAPPGPPLPPLTVFLVDDDEDVRFLMARMLKKAGLRQVKLFPGGAQALAALGSGELPDLVILDQNMPGMNGIETMERIRRLHPELPILISSGQPDLEAWACFHQPRVGVISKPFTLGEIQTRLAEFAAGAGPGR